MKTFKPTYQTKDGETKTVDHYYLRYRGRRYSLGVATGLEAANCMTGGWEDAIIQGFAAWRVIERNHGGVLCLDLDQRTITGLPPE